MAAKVKLAILGTGAYFVAKNLARYANIKTHPMRLKQGSIDTKL